MNIALWIAAGLLALVFLVAGFNKLVLPYDRLITSPGGAWVADFRPWFVKTLGILEVPGAVGLILPGLLGMAPILVPIAACGLAVIMAGAVVTRIRRREVRPLILNAVYLALAVLVAWGRFGPEQLG